MWSFAIQRVTFRQAETTERTITLNSLYLPCHMWDEAKKNRICLNFPYIIGTEGFIKNMNITILKGRRRGSLH